MCGPMLSPSSLSLYINIEICYTHKHTCILYIVYCNSSTIIKNGFVYNGRIERN